MEKIKVLYIVPSLKICSGVGNYALNYLKNINKNNINIDFIVGTSEENDYSNEVKNSNGKVYCIPTMGVKNFFRTVKKIKDFMKKNDYDIIHCHVPNMGAFYMHYAKKYGIGARIIHIHATEASDKITKKIRNKILTDYAIKKSNYYCACSVEAGKKFFKNKEFIVIKNAINGKRFEYDEKTREEIRKQYNISKKEVVIGNVGRLVSEKNQKFLLDIFQLFQLKISNSKLIIVGNGELEKDLKEYAKKLNISNKVLLLEARTDIEKIYQAMDIFILPSLYEGFGIVLLEAQTSGLPCIMSDTVPEAAKITDYYERISLNEKKEIWIERIEKYIGKERKSNIKNLVEKGYDITTEADKLEKFYEEIYTKEN